MAFAFLCAVSSKEMVPSFQIIIGKDRDGCPGTAEYPDSWHPSARLRDRRDIVDHAVQTQPMVTEVSLSILHAAAVAGNMILPVCVQGLCR